MRRKVAAMVLSLGVVFFIASSGALYFLPRVDKSSSNGSVTLEVNNIESETLSFESLSLKPGDQRDFSINLKSSSSAKYNISLDFIQNVNDGLEEFIDVEIKYNDFSYTSSLADLFLGESIVSFTCEFDKPSTEKVSISYLMSPDAGNDVQGKVLDFGLKVNIDG